MNPQQGPRRWSDLPPNAVQLISSKLPTARNAVSLALVDRAARDATRANLQRRTVEVKARAAQVAAMMRHIVIAMPHLLGWARPPLEPSLQQVPGTQLKIVRRGGYDHFEGSYTISGKVYYVSMRYDGKYKIIVKDRRRVLVDVLLDRRKRGPKAVLAVGHPHTPEEMAALRLGLKRVGIRFSTVSSISLHGDWHHEGL